MYNQLLNKYEAKFWQLRKAKTITAYYHLLSDFEIAKKDFFDYKKAVNKTEVLK